MFRSTYEKIENRFLAGTKVTAYYGDRPFQPVCIPDQLLLFHKGSRKLGLLIEIGEQQMAIRDQSQGSYLRDDWKSFFLVDDQGNPIPQEPVTDFFGKPIVVGTWIVFTPYKRDNLKVGRVERFTPIGAIMARQVIEGGGMRDMGSILHRVEGGHDAIVLPDDNEMVIAGKAVLK